MARGNLKRRCKPDLFDIADSLVRLSTQTDSYGFHTDLTNPAMDKANECERFPEHVLIILRSLLGNKMCVDCHKFKELTWASTSFGVLMCEECAFEHISSGLAEKCTNVRSLTKNTWNLKEVIALLEGGNTQFLKLIGGNTALAAFEESRKWASTRAINDPKVNITRRDSLINTKATNNAQEDDFSKYKKKNAKLYIKKLADRVEAVMNTFSRNQGFNTRGQMKVIEDPAFKPMKPITDPDSGKVFGGTLMHSQSEYVR